MQYFMTFSGTEIQSVLDAFLVGLGTARLPSTLHALETVFFINGAIKSPTLLAQEIFANVYFTVISGK